jgi:hypothetical protein
MFITLEVAKMHLRVDGTDEDALITLMSSAAEGSAVAYLNRQVYVDQDALDAAVVALTARDNAIVITDDIRAAMLLILGHLHSHREDVIVGVSTAALPMGSRYLLEQHRISPGI